MICPYCGKEMEVGSLQDNHPIWWRKGTERPLFSRAWFSKERVVLSGPDFVKGSAVVAHLCRDCGKVIIDYSDPGSDLNRGS